MNANGIEVPGLYYFNAVGVGMVTLVGFGSKDYPLGRGNCFHVVADDGRDYQIVNFWYENLEEALRRGTSDDPWAPGVKWPIRCMAIRDPTDMKRPGVGLALVHDPRIPIDWYAKEWCTSCCPMDFLSLPYRLGVALARESGEEVVLVSGGIVMTQSSTDRKVRLPGV